MSKLNQVELNKWVLEIFFHNLEAMELIQVSFFYKFYEFRWTKEDVIKDWYVLPDEKHDKN